VEAEFEAFLFEILSDFQVSIPEYGTIRARQIPMVVLTSNRARELSDGLKRRCVFLYIDFPTVEKEVKIIHTKVPGTGERLSHQIARAVQLIRSNQEIKKKPSIAETLDWARALLALDADRLTADVVGKTVNLLLKNKEDLDTFFHNIRVDELVAYALNDKESAGAQARIRGGGR